MTSTNFSFSEAFAFRKLEFEDKFRSSNPEAAIIVKYLFIAWKKLFEYHTPTYFKHDLPSVLQNQSSDCFTKKNYITFSIIRT